MGGVDRDKGLLCESHLSVATWRGSRENGDRFSMTESARVQPSLRGGSGDMQPGKKALDFNSLK